MQNLCQQHPEKSPEKLLSKLASGAITHAVDFDVYGVGQFLGKFEKEVAGLMGKEAAVYVITGTLAQHSALIALGCRKAQLILHPTSHLVHLDCLRDGDTQDKLKAKTAQTTLVENLGLSLSPIFYGQFDQCPTFRGIEACLEHLSQSVPAILVIELPQRMNGGATMSLADLRRVRELCVEKGILMHLDGARLWEVQPFYDVPMSDICKYFDSVYISWYKGMGALGGACLCGTASFIAGAKNVQKLRGGNTFSTRTITALDCQLQFDYALPLFKNRFDVLCVFVEAMKEMLRSKTEERLRFDPESPESTMTHIYIHFTCGLQGLLRAHERAATDTKCRLWNSLRGPGHSRFSKEGMDTMYWEMSIGDNNMALIGSHMERGLQSFNRLLMNLMEEEEEACRSPLVIFDFDWSLINENTDTYIIKELTNETSFYEELMQKRKDESMGWNDLMNYAVGRICGPPFSRTRNQFESCLRGIPYFQEMFAAATLASRRGAKMIILSDANQFYIDVILEHHNLKSIFHHIFTNHAEWDITCNALKISPFHGSSKHPNIGSGGPPHACSHCPENLCKGEVLEQIRKNYGHRRIVYVGDGCGDFCPFLRLNRRDVFYARQDFSCHKKINKLCDFSEGNFPEFRLWRDGADVLKFIKEDLSF